MKFESLTSAKGRDGRFNQREERRPVRLLGFLVPAGRRGDEVTLLDLSYEGCSVETDLELTAGDKVELSVMSRGAIEAEVRWFANGKAGLVFANKEAPEKRYWPRRHDRRPVEAQVAMRRLGKGSHRVRVYDISPSGCRVEFIDKPQLDENVVIRFDGLEGMHSEVCWTSPNCAGLRFERAIHPAVFDLLVDRLGL